MLLSRHLGGNQACFLRGRGARNAGACTRRVPHRRRHPLSHTQRTATADRELTDDASMSSALQVLREAATRKSVAPEEVEEAMALVELQTKQAASMILMQYIPVTEDLRVDVGAKTISLESVLGPFNFLINGEASSFDAASGALNFQFKEVQVFLFGNKVRQVPESAAPIKVWTKERPKTSPKTYTFFYIDPEGSVPLISIARSSAGGLSLLLRDP
eukprot:1157355-Pelagomonas_calceolata.AAC.2